MSRGPGSHASQRLLRGVQLRGDGNVVPGDVVVAVDGKPVESVARFLATLDAHQVGETVKVTVMRATTPLDITVTIQPGGQ